jgi:multidrug transporter EmrE-like cation transporter
MIGSVRLKNASPIAAKLLIEEVFNISIFCATVNGRFSRAFNSSQLCLITSLVIACCFSCLVNSSVVLPIEVAYLS